MKRTCAGSRRRSSGAELGRAELPQQSVASTAGDGPGSNGHGLGSLLNMGSLRQLVESRRDEIAAVVRRHKGRSVWIFGSVARGEERPGSDIDFLVQFEPGSSLFDLMDLEAELEELLGVQVDVVSAGGLKDRDRHLREEAVSLA